jgi:ABC-type Mn2+/Zn2+ transport system ATPase subunit
VNRSVLEIENLSIRRRRREVLAVDRLSVDSGEVVALLGTNGAGKSSLLESLLGLIPFQAGRLDLMGQPVGDLNGRNLARLRRRIGYMPQSFAGRDEVPLTVREVVMIGRTAGVGWFGRLKKEDRRAVDDWLARLGLGELANRPFGMLSGGQRRKALLGAAMVGSPELLLLDEPTANLDLAAREQFVQALDWLIRGQPGLTVLLVCHELEVIPTECRRIVLLDNRQVVADGRCESVLTEERVKSLYGPNFKLIEHDGRRLVLAERSGFLRPNAEQGGDQ